MDTKLDLGNGNKRIHRAGVTSPITLFLGAMAVTLKCLLLAGDGRPRWDWDRQDEEQQPEIAADIAAISPSSFPALFFLY